jgi:uncharacterized protein
LHFASGPRFTLQSFLLSFGPESKKGFTLQSLAHPLINRSIYLFLIPMKAMRTLKLLLSGMLFFNCASAQEENIVLRTATGDIDGTLMMPQNVTTAPVVLIIAGSGPTDRNCNMGDNETNAYKLLAEELRKNNIASVRYDKRGIGKSDMGVPEESQLSFEMYVDDVREWTDLLSRDKRFSSLILAGHSEGSLLGMLAAQNNNNVHGLVSIAGAGRPADVIIKEQLASVPEQIRMNLYSMLDRLKRGDTISNVPPIFYSLFRPGIQPYMISWFKYDPAEEIKKIKIPVLIVQGLTDLQVKEEDAALLSKARPDATLKLIPNMNHVLKNCDSLGRKYQAPIYKDPLLPLNCELSSAMITFAKAVRQALQEKKMPAEKPKR